MTAPATILIAPDKFKGSLDAAEVAAAIAAGIHAVAPEARTVEIPIADGGDGTVAAALSAGFSPVDVEVRGPVGDPHNTRIAIRDEIAVVELALASGLALLPTNRLSPMTASSYGTGEAIRHALDAGARTIILGIGGSASTDGGAGMLQALGVRISNRIGEELEPGGAALASTHAVDTSGLDPRIGDATFILASDVDNPLLGPAGAAAVYGPQKGANPKQVEKLDAALARFAERTAESIGGDLDFVTLPGAGAAGGVGYAAMAVLGATMRPGVDVILELTDFETTLPQAGLVITGEGRLDAQTLHGKGPAGVAQRALRQGIPVAAVCGSLDLKQDALRDAGFIAAYPLTAVEPDIAICIAEPARLLKICGELLARELLLGD
ncbi:glycerate kinase [Saxibacter everestensis]|uniref:Glycerate kinase n=1 Tax=Saxibacter everestensis TaxID=2909229 RepID=A0ABY8QS59_9MICO|nr:glycerate kinase [Brevibacteriaceae bacterium ZFBP1038]